MRRHAPFRSSTRQLIVPPKPPPPPRVLGAEVVAAKADGAEYTLCLEGYRIDEDRRPTQTVVHYLPPELGGAPLPDGYTHVVRRKLPRGAVEWTLARLVAKRRHTGARRPELGRQQQHLRATQPPLRFFRWTEVAPPAASPRP